MQSAQASPSNTSSATTQSASADQVVATIPVGTNPGAIAVNPSTNTIYVANSNSPNTSGSISVINGTTNTVTTTIPLSSSAMDINPNTNMIYSISVYGPLGVSVINGSTNQVVTTIPTQGGPTGISVNPDTNQIYVAETEHKTGGPVGFIQTINGTTNTVANTASVDIANGNMIVNPNTNQVYLQSAWDGSIIVFDGTTQTVSAKIPGGTIGELAINLVTNRLYDTSEGNPEIIDTNTNAVIGTIQVGNAAFIGLNPNTNEIYVGSGGYSGASSNTIYVINGSTDAIVQTLQVGSDNHIIQTNPIAVNSNTNKIYVANFNSNSVSVIGGSSSSTTVPSPPQNLQTTAGNAQVSLSWATPSNNGGSPITNYNVYRGTSSGSETLLTQIGNATLYNDTTVTNGQAYFYKVTTVNSVGESPQSNEASTTPTAPASGIVVYNTQSTSGTVSSSPYQITFLISMQALAVTTSL